MKFKFFLILVFLSSCSQNYSKLSNKVPYSAKGFAYIFNEKDFENKIIKTRLNSNLLEISHNQLKTGTLIKLINPKSNDTLVLKNKKKSKYPDFYKILITTEVAKKLNINSEFPFIEIIEIQKNKSFIAKKTKIYKEEKKIHSKAPVALVKIDNISKNKNLKSRPNNNEMYIVIAEFYQKESAQLLKKRIINELTNFDSKLFLIKIKKMNEIALLSGPYNSINLMKNDYIQLKNFGFEELDITIDE